MTLECCIAGRPVFIARFSDEYHDICGCDADLAPACMARILELSGPA